MRTGISFVHSDGDRHWLDSIVADRNAPQKAPVSADLSFHCGPLASVQDRSILLVDDDPQVRSAAAEMAIMLPPSRGADALSRSQGNPFHLLLADQVMPGMTGLELAARAKAVRPDLHVLLVTGYPDPGALPPAVSAVLCKPFSLEELRAALDTLSPVGVPDGDAAAEAAS